MESIGSEGLRKRHPVISHKTMPQETAIELASLASNPQFPTSMDDEITSTPFQTRAGSPSNAQIIPHTVAQAVKFMQDLNTIAEKKDGNTNQLFYDAADDNDDDTPLVSVPKKRYCGFTKFRVAVLWLYVVVMVLVVMVMPVIHHNCKVGPSTHCKVVISSFDNFS